jgi:hypothetical protein
MGNVAPTAGVIGRFPRCAAALERLSSPIEPDDTAIDAGRGGRQR